MKHTSFLLMIALLGPAAAKIYTGFNYGAFWSEQSNVKRYAEFHHGFELAKNLTKTPVPFDSARLYTCIAAGTKNDPTEAFRAAIDTGTNLLLGMWVSPRATDQLNDALVENELAALGKGFEQHGQKLADLVIGLSVGNEDIYRFNSQQAGVGSDNLLLTMDSVREKIATSPWAKYLEGKPIGHTDTAMYAVVPGSDFVGMTAYPYWEGQSIDNANATFMSILKGTQRRAGNISVWISEMGWPINGTKIKDAVAIADNYQQHWNEVGCQVFGKYNTFWFELLQDSLPDRPDWGLLDTKTYKPRIKDLSCDGRRNMTTSAAGDFLGASNASLSQREPTTFSTIYIPASRSSSIGPASSSLSGNLTITSTPPTRTIHTTETRTTTVSPTSSATGGAAKDFTAFLTTTTYVSAAPSSNAILPTSGTSSGGRTKACIVMMDPMGDGVFMPVVTYAADLSTCTPPPQFTGSPFTMIAGPMTAHNATKQKSSFNLWPQTSIVEKSSFGLLAPSTTSSPAPSITVVQSNGPTCVTSAGVTYEAVILNGQTYTGKPTPSCPSDEPAASVPTTAALIAPKSSTLTAASSVSPPTISSVNSTFSLPSAPPLSTFLTVTVPSSISCSGSAPAHSTTVNSIHPFSPSLAWTMFPPIPISPSPVPITPPPSPLASPTKPSCTEGALVCTTVRDGQGWVASVVGGHPHILNPSGGPVKCSSTNTCALTPTPTPTGGVEDAEGEIICLKIGLQARISSGVPWILDPPAPCSSTLAPAAASSPFNADAFFSGVLEPWKSTTWAAPMSVLTAAAAPLSLTTAQPR